MTGKPYGTVAGASLGVWCSLPPALVNYEYDIEAGFMVEKVETVSKHWS